MRVGIKILQKCWKHFQLIATRVYYKNLKSNFAGYFEKCLGKKQKKCCIMGSSHRQKSCLMFRTKY